MMPILLTLVMATSSLPANQPFVQMLSNDAVLELPVSPSSIAALIDFDASFYGVSADLMRGIVLRESKFNQYAVGDHGTSFGLVQIHLSAHPTISRAEAYNPIFALNFLAKSLAEGKGRMWSTYAAALKETQEVADSSP